MSHDGRSIKIVYRTYLAVVFVVGVAIMSTVMQCCVSAARIGAHKGLCFSLLLTGSRSYSRVVLNKSASRAVLSGSPLVYNKSVKEVIGSPKSGDYVEVVNEDQSIVGRGMYNEKSMYRVRLLARKLDKLFSAPQEELISARIEDAVKCRAALCLPSASTNAYRLIK
jgi:glutamate 5-kinase